jgi:hypothetical protein
MRGLAALALLLPLLALAACAGLREETTSPPLPPEAKPVGPAEVTPAPLPQPRPGLAISGEAPSGQGGSLPLEAASIDRKIIYNARLEMEVADVDRAAAEVQRLVTALGGFLVSANVRDEGQGEERRRVAEVSVRVPTTAYADALAQLRQLASRLRSETAQSNDVTEEYADLQARLRNLRATEARYLELLAQARNVGEVLQVQDRLNAVRLEIERVQGRLNLLDRLTDMAAITVRLEPPAAPAPQGPWHPGQAVADAWQALQAVLRALATAAIYMVIAGGWLAALLALALLAVRRWLLARGGA